MYSWFIGKSSVVKSTCNNQCFFIIFHSGKFKEIAKLIVFLFKKRKLGEELSAPIQVLQTSDFNIRKIYNELIEQFLFCKDLPESTRGQDIFKLVSNYFSIALLSWQSCLRVFTSGCPALISYLIGFFTLVKKKNLGIIFTHCFVHTEALVAKLLVPEFNEML